MIEGNSGSLEDAIAAITFIEGLAGEGVNLELKRDVVTVRNPKK